MSNSQFSTYFVRYLELAKQARDQNQHHDHRRQLFLEFLKDAFDIQQSDVELEKYIQIANQQVPVRGIARIRKGWIDAIFNDLVFEFKRDLKKEEAEGLRELRDYLTTIPNGAQCVGLLTDGLAFTAYVLDDGQPYGLKNIDGINLEITTPHVAYLWLDAYLLRQRDVSPTSADIVGRFGLNSPTFVASAQSLRKALKVFGVSELGALEVKRQQWAFYLARVYGNTDVSNDEMFVRHTYLCQFAKILAYAVRFGVGETTQQIKGIIDGSAFEILGFNNIGEQDFFSWVLAPEVCALTLGVFNHIAASLAVYDLHNIDEDLLKQLYQNLVEPETRHELGEFYTPDWLAELTLREIGYRPGQSLLDPACGSGTFLFTAIRLIIAQGMAGQELVDFALENIMGIDVHPLAVTIAKINYMLAILPHMHSGTRRGQQRSIPVTMANALQVPSKSHRIEVIEVPINGERSFQIPVTAAQHPNELMDVLKQMGRFAQSMAKLPEDKIKYGDFGDQALKKIPLASSIQDVQTERLTWITNARWLTKQIIEGRDSIWVYVLQNISRPLFLRYRKFDVVVGNPPWISYRYLQDRIYQMEIKKLTLSYGLHASGDRKLNTHIELATLFFEHCRQIYLKPEDGMIAFVMPRSVITGAKQHIAFQQHGFTRILDLKGVAPLFNVETCVMLSEHDRVYTKSIPTVRFDGRLPAHECTWGEASAVLTRKETVTDFVIQEAIASPYYFSRFKEGATLVPRNLVFVTSAQPNIVPGQLAVTSIMHTDPDLNDEAKNPWKGLRCQGHIDDDFLYTTLLSKNLVPFGVRKLHLVALPMKVGMLKQVTSLPGKIKEESFIPISLEEMRNNFDVSRSADDWFEPTGQLWQKYRKSVGMDLWDRFNYQQGVIGQSAAPGYLVLYGATGSNISACVVDTHNLPSVNGAHPKAFVVDYKAYWYRSATKNEAYFLAALLNAPCIDNAIKAYQTRGIYVGARDIGRRPFEVCAIPQFDEDNPDHQQLALYGETAHGVVTAIDLSHGGVVAARKRARQAVRMYIDWIDAIAQRIVGLTPASNSELEEVDEENSGDAMLD